VGNEGPDGFAQRGDDDMGTSDSSHIKGCFNKDFFIKASFNLLLIQPSRPFMHTPYCGFANPNRSITAFSLAIVSCANCVYCAVLL